MTSLKLIKQDLGRASLGVWVEHPLGYRFRVARMGNDSYRAAVEKLLKPHRDEIRRGVLSDAKIEELSREAVATHILTGWENIEDDDGNAIPYSPAKAAEVLFNPELVDLYDFVLNTARRAELYRLNEREESLGNSERSSSGASPSRAESTS